ncbi:TPA: response regulator transcription factor [Streptococcus pneumoniae]|nr:response regulator transcription factor [Streptococcus pneumoniae]
MRIFVLEDDFSQQTRIETTIEKLLKAHHIIPSSFEVFGKLDQLLAEVHEKGDHQLFFLDIEIRNEEMKGLEVARKIRDRDPYALIVFVTTHSEFMPLSFRYQVSALDYIDKALSAEEFESRIETALLYANSQDSKSLAEDCFYFKSKFAQFQYPFKEVYYLETSTRPHRVILYTKTDRLEFTASLEEVLKQEPRLLQCHRSFLINPANVVHLDKKEKLLFFPNGGSCLIARYKVREVSEAINNLH